jgi:L-fuconolactonase
MVGGARLKVPWRAMRIDAHQHFWRYAPEEYGWIGTPMAALQRDFLPSDLLPLLERNGIDACIAVQARQSLAETDWLLELTREHPWIAGVVGWVDLCAPDAPDRIERAARDERLVGLRHVAQDEPDDFLLRGDFARGLGHLARHDLAYDILIYARQLPAALELVGRFPRQTFVLDHLGKPSVRRREREPWTAQLRALAARPNVACKLSGLATEAEWERWRPLDLAPYLNTALEVFGVERVMFGSDWPVCTLAASYERWLEHLWGWSSTLAPSERDALFGGTAARIYGLEPRTK